MDQGALRSINRSAVEVFSDADLLKVLVEKNVDTIQCETWVVRYLALFSSCKGARAHVSVLINWIKGLFVVKISADTVVTEFCWRRMDGLPVGEYIILLSNFNGIPGQSQIRFNEPASLALNLNSVSRIPPVRIEWFSTFCEDLMNISPRGGTRPQTSISEQSMELHGVLLRYQATGDFTELNKRGFFSRGGDRIRLVLALHMIVDRIYEVFFVRCSRRLHILKRALCLSYGVIDLTPPLRGVAGDAEFRFFPQLSGVHVGMNPHDIAVFNAENGGTGPRVSFDLVGAPLE